MPSDAVSISFISTIGGIIIAYIVNVLAKKRRQTRPAKDRMESIFDGYEALIKRQDIDIVRKSATIEQLQDIVDKLRIQVESSQLVINDLKKQLTDTEKRNTEVLAQLDDWKKRYKDETKDPS